MGSKQLPKKTARTTAARPTSTKNWKVLPEGLSAEEILKRAEASKRKPKPKNPTSRKTKKPSVLKGLPRLKKRRNITDKLRNKVAAQTDLAPPGARQQISNEERLVILARRAVYLHGFECMPYREIAKKLKEEFSLSYLPPIPTICRWMTIGKAEFLDDLTDMRNQLRFQQFNECEELKTEWLQVALRNVLVRRYEMHDGKQVEVIDEDPIKECSKGAEIYLKILDRQARLLGMDLAGTETQEGKRQTPQEIYLYIQNLIQNNAPSEKTLNARGIPTFGGLELCLDSPE